MIAIEEFEQLDKLKNPGTEQLKNAILSLNCTPDRIKPFVKAPELLPYGRHVLFRNDQLELIVVQVPPGQTTGIHDHGDSIGCTYVVEGRMLNINFTVNGSGKANYEAEQKVAKGQFLNLGHGAVHSMNNPYSEPLITVHVYSPPLSGVTRYEQEWVLDYVI